MTVETIQTSDIENPVYSVVVPTRDRCGHMLRNCLRSIQLQTLEQVELIVVDYGSTQENHNKLIDMLPPCTVYKYETDEPWNLSAARNIGLRRATAPHSCTLDSDLIMEPYTLKSTLKIHNDYNPCYVTFQVTLLSPQAPSPSILELPRDYDKLTLAHIIKRSEGWGGFISAPTSWWHTCQGFDERMTWWGWEDVDMWKRVARAGLARNRLQVAMYPDSEIYHQYHVNAQISAIKQRRIDIYNAITTNEHYAKHTKGILRNDENWGIWNED